MPFFQRPPRASWEQRPLSWVHLGAFLAFVLVNQGLAAMNERHQAQRLAAQARRAGEPLRWTAHDSAAERPALALGHVQHGPLLVTVRQAIRDERLTAVAQSQPLPEVEACMERGELVVRNLDLNRGCDSGP